MMCWVGLVSKAEIRNDEERGRQELEFVGSCSHGMENQAFNVLGLSVEKCDKTICFHKLIFTFV